MKYLIAFLVFAFGSSTSAQQLDLQALLDSVPEALYRPGTPTPISIPPGEYVVANTLTVSRPTRIEAYGVVIRTPVGVPGLHLTSGADYSQVIGLTMAGPRREDDSGSIGILSNAHAALLRDVTVAEYTTGIHIDSANGAGNANGPRIDGAHVWQCQLGLRIDGPDSNAGLFEAMNFNANLRAIEDSSFLGNTFIGIVSHPQPQRHLPPDFVSDNANHSSVWVGTYSEGRSGIYTESRKSILVGGNVLESASGRADMVGSRRGRLWFQSRTDGEPYPRMEAAVAPGPEISIRWIYTNENGIRQNWFVRHWPAQQEWCITSNGTRRGCVFTWPDP